MYTYNSSFDDRNFCRDETSRRARLPKRDIYTPSLESKLNLLSESDKYIISSDYDEKRDVKFESLYDDLSKKVLSKEILSSMKDWELYMRCKEHETKINSIPNDEIPSIRNYDTIQFSFEKHTSNFTFSYPKVEIRARDETEEISETEQQEKRMIALAEKIRGNRAYKENDFIKACEHYSNSIAAAPIIEAYNNRAQANMKLNNFSSALPDLNEVLRQDPKNIKALYRRAKCKHVLCMYNEALKDLSIVLKLEPFNKEAQPMMNEIKSIIANLKGKKYRIRENFGDRETFDIDISQLPVYARCDESYILEVDRAGGCMKSCVCGFCINEDRFIRPKSTSLRIKERDRWKRLTLALLDEMRLSSSIVDKAVSKDLKEMANAQCSNKTKLANGDTNVDDIQNTFRKINLQTGPSKGSSKILNHSGNDGLLLRNVQPSSLKKKFNITMDDKTLTNVLRSVYDEFDAETELELILEYLRNIATLERFKINIKFVEEKTKKDIRELLNKAIKLNLDNLSELEKLYS